MLSDQLTRGAAALADAGCETPRLDAELLLAAALGVDRAALVIGARDPLAPADRERYERMLARRIAREPVAYMLGRRYFRRLCLHVDTSVLIPRAETELLVEVGLMLPAGARVADVGTGSGAVALALKDERPDLAVSGIDQSERALAVARANGERLGLRVAWLLADLLDGGDYDAVLANLPYVAHGAQLAPEITRFEPADALFAGADGLEVIRRLTTMVSESAGVALLALEIGFDQADAVRALVRDAGFGDLAVLRDLSGHERVVVGRR